MSQMTSPQETQTPLQSRHGSLPPHETSTSPHLRHPHRPHTAWRRTIGVALGAAAAVALVVTAFVWPTITSSVKDVPIAVVGTSQQVGAITDSLNQQADGVFAVTAVADRQAAVDLINRRDVYGAIVVGQTPEILTASANGAAVSQLLGQLAAPIQAQATTVAQAAVAQKVAAGQAPAGSIAPPITVTVTDVVPLAPTDARGLGLTAASFPLVLGGIVGGVLISLLITGVWRRLTSVVVYAVLAGMGTTLIMQPWFGILQGTFAVNAAAITLAMAATAAFVVGSNALLGRAGIVVGSVLTMLIGNPLSSAAQPLQFTVAPWGAVGQWFVPGASSTLLRDLSYFPATNTLFPWLVLAGWTTLGIIVMFAGHFRNQQVLRGLAVSEGSA